jgi:glycosyltransferase involved in cell wall biosynthesis
VQELARHLARTGDDVEIILHTWEDGFAEQADRDGLNVLQFRPAVGGVDYALSVELWSYLRRNAHRFDVVHAHGYRSLPAVPLMRSGGRPFVFSPYYHLVPVTRLRRFVRQPYRQLARRAIGSADLAVCVSEVEATALRAAVPELRGRISVVPAGADAAAIRSAQPYPKECTTIVTLGPLESGKRIDRVISALPDLGPKYELVIVGRGRERRALRAHAANLGVADRIRFAGPVDDAALFRWLRTADVVVAVADDAMSGGTLLEAACAGAPVIASDIPAHLEASARLFPAAVRLISSQSSPLTLADEIVAATDAGPPRGPPPAITTWNETAAQTADLYRELLEGASVAGTSPKQKAHDR